MRPNREIASPSHGKLAPDPAGYPLFGVLPEIRKDPLRLLTRSVREFGDVVRLPAGPKVVHLVAAPEHIKHVLQDNAKNYSKETRGFQTLRYVLGLGLVTSDGELWRRQRRIAQPAFQRQRLAALGGRMVVAAIEAESRLRGHAERRQAFDVASEMMRLTLRIACDTLLGADVHDQADAVGGALTELLEGTRRRIFRLFDLSVELPTPANRRFAAAKRTIDSVVYRIIDQRRRAEREGAPEQDDLLSILLHARDEVTGERMNDTQLRDEVLTMFLAGHETTANALAWTFYLLSKFPAVHGKLRDELGEVLNGRDPTVEDVPHLKYTTMVLEESMRLYPPAWMITRSPREPDIIGGYAIPVGGYVAVSPYVTHRHPDLWDNPEGFDPERFTPEKVAARPRFAYFPFGGGPRQCIGSHFAMMESVLLLATLARRLRLDLVPGHPVLPNPIITLRPRHGILMTARAG